MVRATLLLLLLAAAACTRTDQEANGAAPQRPVTPPADLSALEIKSFAIYDGQRKATQEQEQLLGATKKAMASILFDPFSAHYQKLRAGRNGAICGEVNGKNRMGAYIGFKDFVIPRDRSTAHISEAAGGFTGELYSAFTSAYIASCANQQEVRLYNILTAPTPVATPPVEDDVPAGSDI